MVRGVPGDPLEWESGDALIPGQGETFMTVHGAVASPLYSTPSGDSRG